MTSGRWPTSTAPAGTCWSGRRRRGRSISNTAVAVHPDVDLRRSRAAEGELLVVAEPLLGKVLGEDADEVLAHVPGLRARAHDLLPAVRPRRLPRGSARALRRARRLRDHRGRHRPGAPGAGLRRRRPRRRAPVRPAGRQPGRAPTAPSSRDVPLVGGLFFKDADKAHRRRSARARPAVPARAVRARLSALLALRHPADLLRAAVVVHPHDCDQGPAARRERQAPTGTRRRSSDGRYGDWLENNIDWALSRNRYWGTPLPIWRCADGHAHRRRLAGRAADRLLGGTCPTSTRTGRSSTTSTFPVPTCRLETSRVPEVIDGWYDSGSMPFAQFGYPHSGPSRRPSSRRPTRPTSSARRSTRPAAGSTR